MRPNSIIIIKLIILCTVAQVGVVLSFVHATPNLVHGYTSVSKFYE